VASYPKKQAKSVWNNGIVDAPWYG